MNSFYFYLTIFCLLNSINLQAQTIRYVKPIASGLGNGSSWANASSDIQEMIDYVATNGSGSKEVWVAAGMYKPSKDAFGNSAPTDLRDKTFYLKDGVKLYGGFAGTESSIALRNINVNVTTLNGDLGIINDQTDNCYHVLVASAISNGGIGITLDGFTIINGNADGNSVYNLNGNNITGYSGGGILIYNGINSIKNNTIQENYASSGGGIQSNNGQNTLFNNTIRKNIGWSGGGIQSSNGQSTFLNNIVDSNFSYGDGAGLLLNSGINTISNCTISNNETMQGGNGGGIADMSITSQISNNTIHNNYGANGGGVYSWAVNSTLSNNEIDSNRAFQGGGIEIVGSKIKVFHNIIHSNSFVTRGGGINAETGDTTWIANNIIYNNVAYTGSGASNSYGGGVHLHWNTGGNIRYLYNNVIYNNHADNGGGVSTQSGFALITNNTIFSNIADTKGGGLCEDYGSGEFSNNIFWENKKGTNSNVFEADISLSNSIYWNTLTLFNNSFQQANYNGLGSFLNPQFLNPNDPDGIDNTYFTADDGLSLACGSTLINAGITTNPPIAIDIVGNSRVGNYDLGAYEHQSAAAFNAQVTLNQTGTTIYGPCPTICSVVSNGTSPISGPTTAKVWVETSQDPTFVKRHYEITPTNNSSTATGRVTLYFFQSEFNAFNAVSNLYLPTGPNDLSRISNILIEKRPGVSSNGTGLPNTYTGTPITINPNDNDIVWNSALNRWEISFDVTGFSGFFLKTQASVLPVSLLSFEGYSQGHINVLQWITSNEINNSGFEIERAMHKDQASNLEWETLDFIKGAGNSSINQLYKYNDIPPYSGSAYYRLKQIDIDGNYSYSKIINISSCSESDLTIYPNPSTTGHFIISNAKFNNKTVTLSNMYGQSFDMVIHQNILDLSLMPKGMYFLKLNTEIFRLVIQ